MLAGSTADGSGAGYRQVPAPESEGFVHRRNRLSCAAAGEGDWVIRTLLVAATGPPTILLTAALVVLACCWLLVAGGVTDVDSFDADMDLRRWRLEGVPAIVAFSLLTVLAWSLSVGATVVLVVFGTPGPATGLLRLVLPVGALLVAWGMTCLIVGPVHRRFRDAGGPDPCGDASPCTALRPGDRAV
jgi:polyferredoxin